MASKILGIFVTLAVTAFIGMVIMCVTHVVLTGEDPRPSLTPSPTIMLSPSPTTAPSPSPTPTHAPEYILIDDFTTERPDLWIKSPYGGPHGTQFKPEMVYVSHYDSELVVLADVQSHTGGQYGSQTTYGFGKYKARIKTCITPGVTMAFFTYKGPEPDGHNEIDIEFINKNGKTDAYFSTYVRHQQNYYVYSLPFDPALDFHEYEFHWYSDRVEFYVDGALIWTSWQYVPQEPCYVLFNNWIFTDAPNDIWDKNVMHVDWIKIEKI